MKHKFARNAGLKLISLLLAFLIWLLVVNVDDPVNTTMFRGIQIQMENEDSVTALDQVYDVVEDDVYGDTAVVKVRERRSITKKLSVADFRVVADMETMNEMGAIPLRVECTNPSVTQDELELIPSVLKVRLEPKKQSEFIVNVVTSGKTANGFEVGSTEVVGGKTVQIAGPESVLKKIGQVVANVRVNGIKTDRRISTTLVIYDKNGDEMTSQMKRLQIKDSSGVLLSENEVMVDITLWEVMNDIPMEIQTSGSPAEGYQVEGISTVPVTLNLVGTKEALARLNGKIAVKQPVDVEGATDNVAAEIDLTETLAELEGLRLVADADPTVSVTVQIEKSGDQTITVPLSSFEILNRPDTGKMSLTISPADEVQVTVHSEAEDGRPLNASEIRAKVDLGPCAQEGVHEIPVQIELPEGYSLVYDVQLVVTSTLQQTEGETGSTEG